MEMASTDASTDATTVEREIAEALDLGIVLDGRRYRRQTAVTFERNVHTAQAARDTGLVRALQGFDPLHDEISERIESLVLDAFTNGTMYRFLACALGEEYVSWTPDVAREAAERFKHVTDPVDQAALYDIASWVLLDFFLNAGASWRTFLKYLRLSRTMTSLTTATRATAESETPDGAGDGNESSNSKDAVARTSDRLGARTVATSTSANGTPSSARSRAASTASR